MNFKLFLETLTDKDVESLLVDKNPTLKVTIRNLRINGHAYTLGMMCGRQSVEPDPAVQLPMENPYVEGSPDHEEWEEGFKHTTELHHYFKDRIISPKPSMSAAYNQNLEKRNDEIRQRLQQLKGRPS